MLRLQMLVALAPFDYTLIRIGSVARQMRLTFGLSKKKNLKSINDNIKLKSKNVPRKTLQPQSCRR